MNLPAIARDWDLFFAEGVRKNQESAAMESLQSSPTFVTTLLVFATGGLFLWSRHARRRAASLPKGVCFPPHVRSWLPYVGSAIEMGSGITEFIRKHANRFQSPVFSATIMGEKYVFLADPELLTTVFKPSVKKYLDDLSLQKQFVARALGAPSIVGDELYEPKINKMAHAQYNKFLFQGRELEASMSRVQTYFREQTVPTLLKGKNCNGGDNEWTNQPLFEFCVHAIFKASSHALLSPSLANDETVQNYWNFDKGILHLFNGLPEFVTKSAATARDELRKSLRGVDDDPSPLMKERKETLGMSQGALDTGNLGLLYAASANSAPAVFWCFCMLLEHPEAWKACKEQVWKVSNNGDPDFVFSLQDLDNLTNLESAFWETLRLYSGNFTSRLVVQDFVLESPHNTKKKFRIEKGTKLMAWWDLLHSDPHVFDQPELFRFDRFVDKKDTKYTYRSGSSLKHSPIMSFGGGSHLCPGRKFISYEIRLFLAMLMLNFDFRLLSTPDGDEQQQTYVRPKIDLEHQGIGIAQPDKDHNVQIRPRRKD